MLTITSPKRCRICVIPFLNVWHSIYVNLPIVQTDEAPRVYEIPGSKPVASERCNSFGDRECEHGNITGDFIATDKPLFTSSGNPVELITIGESSTHFGSLTTYDRIDRSQLHPSYDPEVKGRDYYTGVSLKCDRKCIVGDFKNVSFTATFTARHYGHRTIRRKPVNDSMDKHRFVCRYIYDETGRVYTEITEYGAYWLDSEPEPDEEILSHKEGFGYSFGPGISYGEWVDNSYVPDYGKIYALGRAASMWMHRPSTREYGLVCQQAADSLRYTDINTPVFIKEMIGMKESILSLYDTLRAKKTIRNMADLYLSMKYGYRLTYADAQDLGEAFCEEPKTLTPRGYLTDTKDLPGYFEGLKSSYTLRCKVYVQDQDSAVLNMARSLMDWDLFPSTQNIWDMVPYSFVVDWFVDLETLFNAIDSNSYESTLNVESVVYALKNEVVINNSSIVKDYLGCDVALNSGICVTHFSRKIKQQLTQPPFDISPSEKYSDNYCTLGALIIQKVRKN